MEQLLRDRRAKTLAENARARNRNRIMERLSSDLIIEIISWLPIKYVLRCKSVSKSWEALISDPSFAAIHFNRASTLHRFSDYIDRGREEKPPSFVETDMKLLYFIDIDEEDNDNSTTSKHFNLPFVRRVSSPILIGSCLGYLCFSARDEFLFSATACPTNPVYLFNPITRDNILLPQFKKTRCYSCLYGFGLDVSTQECKVVLVYLYEKTFSVQVHTVGRDCSWRTNTIPSMLTYVTLPELMNGGLQTSLPLDFNGSIHWIVLSSFDNGAKRACILSFQLDTEVFGVIPMPKPLQVIKPYFYNKMVYALQVSGGCLSIIYSPEASIVDMWVMAGYNISKSWVKKYSIQLNCMGRFKLRPLGFRKNGELMLHLRNKGLASYNIDSDKYKILCYCSTIPFPFVGSLIYLKSA